MELKNAVAVCLISLFSATLVVLIARSLDSQAASRLEPQLARIAAELETIRKQGGMAAASSGAATSPAADDGLMVYYFHGVRCPTCRAAESNALAFLESEYALQLQDGEVVWQALDYLNDPAAKAMAEKFGVLTATVVLVKMKDGQMESWNRLDRVLSLADEKPALSAYLEEEIDAMLAAEDAAPELPIEAPAVPLPDGDSQDVPVPSDAAAIPLPE